MGWLLEVDGLDLPAGWVGLSQRGDVDGSRVFALSTGPPTHTYVGVVNRKGGSGQEHIQGGWESQRYFKSGLLSFISKSC